MKFFLQIHIFFIFLVLKTRVMLKLIMEPLSDLEQNLSLIETHDHLVEYFFILQFFMEEKYLVPKTL